MTSPYGVPDATNTMAYPTRPCWTLEYVGPGYSGTYQCHVLREAEARSQFAAFDPRATVTAATFSEVPL